MNKITRWVQVGSEHVGLNESGAVCGRLISLTDESINRAIKKPVRASQKVREDMLEAKIKEYSRKRAERRREAKRNA